MGNTTSTSTRVVLDQGNSGTCYACATSTVICDALKRMGKKPPYINERSLSKEFIGRYGYHSGPLLALLEKECPKWGLRCKEINQQLAIATVRSGKSVVASFHLSQVAWDGFMNFYREHPNGELGELEMMKIMEATGRSEFLRRVKAKGEKHAVAFISVQGNVLVFQNSKGEDWGSGGTFSVFIDAMTPLAMNFVSFYEVTGDGDVATTPDDGSDPRPGKIRRIDTKIDPQIHALLHPNLKYLRCCILPNGEKKYEVSGLDHPL